MTNAMDWPEMENVLIRLGDALEEPTTLVVIGSAVCISMGQADRMTMDIDVWRKDSVFDLGVLKRACESANIIFDPKGYDEPDGVYLQMIDPGIVQLGVFEETALLFRAGNLVVKRPPAENVIASKMVRGEAHDFDDAVFLMKKCRVGLNDISKAIASIDNIVAREIAQENLSLLQACIDLTVPVEKSAIAVLNRSPGDSAGPNL